MADNKTANAGAGGATFATDEIAGVDWPFAKLAWGPRDTANEVDDASGKRLPVKVGDPLPAGTNNIGDVDVLSVPAPLSTTGGGTESTALRVTVASDSTGVLSIDDNGGSITVDGQVEIIQPSSNLLIEGTEIIDSPASGGYNIVASRASTATPAAVSADGDVQAIWVNRNGAVRVDPVGTTTQPVSAASLPLPTGAATAALQTQPGVDIGDVTINNAAGASAVNIQDGGNSITVDGTIAATQSGAWSVRITDGTDTADVLDLTNSNPLTVAIVDGSGNQVTSFGGSGGTSATDDAAFTAGAGSGTPMMGFATSDAVDSGDVGVLAMTTARELKIQAQANSGVDIGDVTINNASGGSAVNIQDGGNSITVDGTVAVSGTVTVDTELPTAETPADNLTNATAAPRVNALNYVFDGSTWDRAKGDSTDGTLVNLGANNDVTITSGTVTTITNVVHVDDNSGSLTVDGTVTANVQPNTSGGLSLSKTISAASTNATNVKGSAGQVYFIYCSNINAAVRYLKLYNKATSPTVGTDTPVLTFAIPGNTAGAGFTFSPEMGLAFGTGIGFALTTGVADADTGAVSANEHVVNIGYK